MLKRWRIASLSLLVAGLPAAHAQKSDFSISLHGQQSEFSMLWNGPDGSLLVFSQGTSKAPQETWMIRRIKGWDTGQPQEQTLTMEVGYGDLPPDHLIPNLSGEQIFLDPGGRFLVVRLSRYARHSWSQSPSRSPGPPEAILNVVDLRSFQVVTHKVVTDPVMAVGEMGMTEHGVLVASGLIAHTGSTEGNVYTDTGQYAVETVRLPDLQPETLCQYTRVVRRLPVMTRYDPEQAQLREQFYREEQLRTRKEEQSANASCAANLAPLGFASLEDLNNQFNEVKQEFRQSRLAARDHHEPWLGCGMEDMSGDKKYVLYDCDQSRVQITLSSHYYRALRVYAVEQGQMVMELRLPHNPSSSAVIATSAGKNYLVLLRGSNHLAGYRLP